VIRILRISGSILTVGGVSFWYGPLASLSLQIASVASEHHSKNNERSQPVKNLGQDHLAVVKTHLSLLDKISHFPAGDV